MHMADYDLSLSKTRNACGCWRFDHGRAVSKTLRAAGHRHQVAAEKVQGALDEAEPKD